MIRGWCGQGSPPSLLTSPSLPPLFPVPAGRTAAAAHAGFAAIGRGGGKSGLQGSTVAANGRRGRPQGKCHREQTAGAGQPAKARVKRCGKSAPRVRQRRRHGKPHREQDRIGAARVLGRKPGHPARSSPPPGLVARGTERSAPQRNGRRGGLSLQTEPGLQAGWQVRLPVTERHASAARGNAGQAILSERSCSEAAGIAASPPRLIAL
jgi:hypothetical protein